MAVVDVAVDAVILVVTIMVVHQEKLGEATIMAVVHVVTEADGIVIVEVAGTMGILAIMITDLEDIITVIIIMVDTIIMAVVDATIIIIIITIIITVDKV